ncbi:TetR/AcrR family transcriptional regulator [Streptomyces sp. NPDC058045]|uniref:TetR/AcrR family transcriptional regulator n=1 Tax=Streptomyces sp. NPDC058045 TaxID=3346311 RepID=UPI0036DFF1BD
MPTARESLLDAAERALGRLPWTRIRMVDVAAVAGVSRQTLYNEFGSKEGLGRALLRREADTCLAGAERVLAGPGPPEERLAALAEWMVTAARRPLARALLTGLWPPRLPAPVRTAMPSAAVAPAQRRADQPLPTPAELATAMRDLALTATCPPDTAPRTRAAWSHRCEITVRLALSCLLVPPGPAGPAALVARGTGLRRTGPSGPSPRAGGRRRR